MSEAWLRVPGVANVSGSANVVQRIVFHWSLRASFRCLAIAAAVLFGVGALSPTPANAETLTFREGVDGYAGTEDLHLAIPADFTGNGHIAAEFTTDPDNPSWEWDTHQTAGEGSMQFYSESPRRGLGDHIGLLRFRDLFGSEPGQIPPGSEVISATLTLHSLSPSASDSANVHRVLVPWDESTRWNDFGITPGPVYDVDLASEIDVVTGALTSGSFDLDVTESVASWSQDPSSNRGWLFMPTRNQDIISVSGSSLGSVTSIVVDIEITTPQRGEIAVTLRHEDATAVLINRLGRSNCSSRSGTSSDDINVTLDPLAATDIHNSSSSSSPLTGTWKPDAYCIADQPLCTASPAGGLCGKPADGEWVLQVADEWVGSGSQAVLVSWSLHLGDGVTTETYSSTPNLVIDKRHGDGGSSDSGKTRIASSEATSSSQRPQLSVIYNPALTASPDVFTGMPGSGSHAIRIEIPEGANDSAPVSVSFASDDGGVALPTNSPLVFPVGGATHQDLLVDLGVAGTATLSTTNDAGIPEIAIPITSAASPITFSSNHLYATTAETDRTISVSIPAGSNAAGDVQVQISSSDPGVAEALGASSGSLDLTFTVGAPTTQDFDVEFGGSAGSAVLTATDDSGALASGSLDVTLREDELVEYDLHVPPYVQLGNPGLGDATDQFVVAWETITRRTGGPNADRFEFQYREAGSPTWIPIAIPTPTPVDSASRLHHAVAIEGLAFDTAYEYRMVHLRNGSALPGETFEATTSTRPTGDSFRFTAFGNSGTGSAGAYAVADQLAALGTDIHLFLGDSVYNFGQVELYRSRIFDLFGELMKSTPFVMTVGNHEANRGLHAYTPSYFHHPENGPAGLDPGFHYSFDIGNVHFAGVKTGNEHSNLVEDVSAWLEADLAASDKTWKIVFSHELPITRDPYGTDKPETDEVREAVLTAAVAAGADLYIGGANHSFQRYLPITAVLEDEPHVEWATCDQGFGTTLIYPGGGSWARGVPGPIPEQLEPPMEFFLPDTGVGVFDVDGETLTATMVDTEGGIIDQIVLNKCWSPAECACDDNLYLYGTAHGNGPVEVTLDDILIQVNPAIGASAAAVLEDLAAAINADSDLAAQGITATATDNLLEVTAPIQSSTIADTGLGDFPSVPSLGPPGLLTLAALVGGLAHLLLRRRRGGAR